MNNFHTPVMLKEAIEGLNIKPGGNTLTPLWGVEAILPKS